jgi:hypothetical protein
MTPHLKLPLQHDLRVQAAAVAMLAAPTTLASAPGFLVQQTVVGCAGVYKHPMHEYHPHNTQKNCQRQYDDKSITAAGQGAAFCI